MTKYEEIYWETKVAIKHIEDRLKTIEWKLNNTPTIRQANRLFNAYLTKFKNEAFAKYDESMIKPYIIYRVNKYYHSLN